MTGDARQKHGLWHAPLGTVLVAALATGWTVAGAAYLTDAPLVIGAAIGLLAGVAGVALWRTTQ